MSIVVPTYVDGCGIVGQQAPPCTSRPPLQRINAQELRNVGGADRPQGSTDCRTGGCQEDSVIEDFLQEQLTNNARMAARVDSVTWGDVNRTLRWCAEWCGERSVVLQRVPGEMPHLQFASAKAPRQRERAKYCPLPVSIVAREASKLSAPQQ